MSAPRPGYGPPAWNPPPQGRAGYDPPPGSPPSGPPSWGPPLPPAPVPPRPTEVTVSFWLWIVMALVGVSGAIVRWATFHGPTAGLVGSSLVVALVSAGIGAALYVTFAVFMYRRHNWARITLTVIAAVGVLFGGIGLAVTASTRLVPTGGPVSTAFTLLQIVIAIAALALFYRPRANEWFAALRHGPA